MSVFENYPFFEGNQGKRIVIKLKNKRPLNYNVSNSETIKKRHNHVEQMTEQESQGDEQRDHSGEPSKLRKSRIDFKKYSRVFPKDFFGIVKTESDAQENTQVFQHKVESHSGLIEKEKVNAQINSDENISSSNQQSQKLDDPSYRKSNENYDPERSNNYQKIKDNNTHQHRRCKSEADSPVKEHYAGNNNNNKQINKQCIDIDKQDRNKLIYCKSRGQFQSQLTTHQDNYCAQQSQKNTPTFISEGTSNLGSFLVKGSDPHVQNEIFPKRILLKRSFHKNNSPKSKENKSIFQSATMKGAVLKSCHVQTKSDINMPTTTSLEQSVFDKLKIDSEQQQQQQSLGKENRQQQIKPNPFLSRIESAKQYTLYNLICNQQEEILKEQLNHGQQQQKNIQQHIYPFDEESLQQFSQQIAKQGKEIKLMNQESQLFRQCTAQNLRNVLSFQQNEDIHQYQLTRCQTERSEREGEQKHYKNVKEQKDKYALNILANRIETVPCVNAYDQNGSIQEKQQKITRISNKLQSKSEKKFQVKGSVSFDNVNYTESSQNYSKVQTKSNNSPLNKGFIQKRERCSTSEAQINRSECFHNEFIDDNNLPIIKLLQRQRLKRRVSEAGAGILESQNMPAIKRNQIFSAQQVDNHLSVLPSNNKLEQLLKSSNTSDQLEFSFKNTGSWQAQELINSKLKPLNEKDISHKGSSVISEASNKAILKSKQCFYPSPVSNIKNQHTKKPVYSTKLSSCALRASAQK